MPVVSLIPQMHLSLLLCGPDLQSWSSKDGSSCSCNTPPHRLSPFESLVFVRFNIRKNKMVLQEMH